MSTGDQRHQGSALSRTWPGQHAGVLPIIVGQNRVLLCGGVVWHLVFVELAIIRRSASAVFFLLGFWLLGRRRVTVVHEAERVLAHVHREPPARVRGSFPCVVAIAGNSLPPSFFDGFYFSLKWVLRLVTRTLNVGSIPIARSRSLLMHLSLRASYTQNSQ
jgi:hypothetical protein